MIFLSLKLMEIGVKNIFLLVQMYTFFLIIAVTMNSPTIAFRKLEKGFLLVVLLSTLRLLVDTLLFLYCTFATFESCKSSLIYAG